jgi:hypothetical protein
MNILLPPTVRRSYFLGGCFLLAAIYLVLVSTDFLATRFSSGPDLTRLRVSAWLEPGNAQYRHTMGRYLLIARGDPAAAIEQYRAAVRLNPHDSRYWFDLAAAYQIAGNVPQQAAAIERAIQADPTKPDAAWEAGNFFLLRGENDRALREFRVVLENDSSMAPAALEMCWRITRDVDALLRQAIPPKPEVYLVLIELLASRKENQAAARVWSALVELGQSFEPRRAFGYVNYLLLQRQPDQARVAWQQMAPLCGLTAYLPSPPNLLVNSRFDLDVLNEGLDWRYQIQPHVKLTLDPNEFESGNRSLSIAFDGQGVKDAGIYQFIPVQPETAYEFSAHFKSDDIQGAGGPRFSLQDAYTETSYLLTDELKNHSIWRAVGGRFQTGPDTRLLVLRLVRVPPRSPIRGKLWIDSLQLIQK